MDRRTVIGGDSNARTGEKGGRIEYEEENKKEAKGRSSEDKVINKNRRRLIQVIEEKGWQIFNGNIKWDEKEEWTYTGGRGETVIDHVIGDREVRKETEKMEIGEEVDSDHMPVVVWIREDVKKGKGRKNMGKKVNGGRWDREGRENFRKELGHREEAERGRSGRVGGEGRRRWWDEECKEENRKMRQELREWKAKEENKEGYRVNKKNYRRLCEIKKKEERERIEKEAGDLKTEGKV